MDDTTTWTIVGELGSLPAGTGTDPVLAAGDLATVTGWTPKPEGWCRGAECIPASFLGDAAHAPYRSAAAVANSLGAAYAVEPEHRVAVIGVRADAASTLASGVAPDLELTALDGSTRRLFADAHDKTLVVAFSSWCGCRYDLPGWKALKDELAEHDFGVVAVAIDEATDDVAPFAEGIDFPVLVDTDRRFADTYGLINVPTVIWLDAERRVVREPSPEFSDDTFTEVHGVESGPHLDAVRRWVTTGDAGDDLALNDPYPGSLSDDQRLARAEFRLALELARAGHDDAAARHVTVADGLAPDDFTIWRAGMQLVGDDPFGAEFFERYTEWQQRHGGPLATTD
jgi:peroxiredoxin